MPTKALRVAAEPGDEMLLLTKREVAELMRVSERAVERLAAAGLLPGRVQIGGAVRWRRADLLRWIEGGGTLSRRR